MKLKYKFALAVFISGVLIMGSASLIYYVYFFRIATQRHFEEFQQYTAIIANHVSGLLIEKAGIAGALTHTPLLRDALSASNHEFQELDAATGKEKIRQLNQRWMASDDPEDPFIREYLSNPTARYLKQIQASSPNQEYGEIFLTNRYGALVAATGKLTTFAHAHKYWWRAACERVRIFLDDRGYDDSVGGHVLGIVVPIYQEDEIAGVLKCNLKIQGGVSDILSKAGRHIPDTLQIVRSGGRVICETGNKSFHVGIPESMRKRFESGKPGAILLDGDGPGRFAGFSPVEITANRINGYGFGANPQSIDHREGNQNEIWYVVKYRPTVIVRQLLWQTAGLLFAIGCVLSMLFSGISVWIGYRLTRPFETLIDATRDIGKGRFDRRIHSSSRDEMGQLAHAFNRMAEELSRISASREELEQEVDLRTRAEKTLREKQERLDHFFKCAPIGIFQSTPEGRYLQINECFAGMLAYEPDELSQIPNIAALYIDPAQRDEVKRLLSEHEKIEDVHIHLRRKDGRDMWMAIYVEARKNARNEITYYDGFTIDITKRKQDETALRESEERYRAIINNSLVGVALRQGARLLMANKAFCDLLGRTETELINSTPEDFLAMIHPDDGEMIYQRHLDRLAGKDVPSRYEYRYINKDGGVVWVDAFVGTITVGGRPSQLGMYVDITNRKKAEQALKDALTEKVVLLREIHHRVKNNMQVIISLLRMHARKNQDPRLKSIFDECRGRIEAMSLIHEALYESDEMARIDFRAYLLKLCRNLGQVHGAAGKGITVSADQGNVALTMDQGVAVGMVIAELISNAFKHAFAADEGGTVTVGMTRIDAKTVELTVADDGKGLPPDFDMASSRSLGMRLVHGAVTRELGGSIDAKNDGGAVFIICFQCGNV